MKKHLIYRSILAVCIFAGSWLNAAGAEVDTGRALQPGFHPVIVNGRILSGPNSLARSSAGRILVPISSIAAAFGDAVEINGAERLITLRRLGVVAVFDVRRGEVSENGAPILTVSNAGLIAFTPASDEMLLPIEIAAPFFGASMRFDNIKGSVIVSRGVASPGVTAIDNDPGSFDLYQANYEYGVSRYIGSTANNLVITATGRLFDGRFSINSSSSGSLRRLSPRMFSFDLERPNGHKFIAGDFGTGSALQLLTANVRGGSASIPVGKFTVAAFGGRADSGSVLPIASFDDPNLFPFRSKVRFDSSVIGGYASSTFGSNLSPIHLTAGAMRFSGPSRSGTASSATAVYNGSRLRMQADAGAGSFNGRDAYDRQVSGVGTAIDISGTFQFNDDLSFHGRVTEISQNFLSPQSGTRDPVSLKAVGLSWSPTRWLSTTFNASATRRPGKTEGSDSYLSAAFGVSPGVGKPRFYLSHSFNRSAHIRSGAFTTFSASHDLRRWRLFLTASRIKMNGPATASLTAGANLLLNDRNSVELSQGIGNRDRLGGAVDWKTSGLFGGRMSLSAGAGYNRASSGSISAFERLSASVKLPKRSSIQINYMHTAVGGPTVLVQLRGSLFQKREAESFISSPIAEAAKLGTISGRVYQDVDGDGKFEPGTDRPQAGVKVRINGNRYVESDVNGVYQFDAVAEGGHRLYLDLLSIRADLTIIDGTAKELSVNGGQTMVYDFRLARTGRATGRVWLDVNGNGIFDEGEEPLADVRIVASTGRDTLTDQDGMFTIADLAPGEQVFLIDEKSLPDKLIPGDSSLAVLILAGRETGNVLLPVKPVPAEVKRFPSRSRE